MPGIDECLLEAMALPGARGAALVDWSSGLALGTVGESPVGDHETTAAETAELARAAAEYESFATNPADPADPPASGAAGADAWRAASGPPVEDLIVTTRTGYHVLRFVATGFDSSVFLHLWLDRSEGNLALARLRLRDLAERLVLR
ncbi:hypothetical protein [Streptomyces bambusae]|uniref:Roadblock/LC7 domain-containing protein n=1 Tax=Streptomyces bambusae TaxID=1550616 RepID=A0ABS6Z7Z1_9ACTN|nr:hypothetical protein [Streptomyces bambusae]MBW5483880.1 hypothetical protein [Streptomyces bambusae]